MTTRHAWSHRASLTGGGTCGLTQSHYPNRHLTCTVSPSLTRSQSQSHTQSHSLTTLRSETPRLRDETSPTSREWRVCLGSAIGRNDAARPGCCGWGAVERLSGVRRCDQGVTSRSLTCGDRVATGLIDPSGSLARVEGEAGDAAAEQVCVVGAEGEAEGEVVLDGANLWRHADDCDAEDLGGLEARVDAAAAVQVAGVAGHGLSVAQAGSRQGETS